MPTPRITPRVQLRQSLANFLATGIEREEAPTSALLSLASRVVLQEALEAEQRDALGRERYERGSEGRYRNWLPAGAGGRRGRAGGDRGAPGAGPARAPFAPAGVSGGA